MAAEVGVGVEIGRRCRCRRRRGRRRPRQTRRRASASSTPGARSGVGPMLTSATPVRVARARRRSRRWPSLARRRLNFWNDQPGALHLWNADLDDHLVGCERGLEEADEEVGRSDLAPAARSLHHDRGVQRKDGGGQVGCGIAVRERAADRAAVADLGVADERRRVPQERQMLPSTSDVSRSR